MEIARGTAGDRPWAELFAELGFSAEPCELTVETGAQSHRVAFAGEAVVWAGSPLAADSALRVALSYGVVTAAMMPAVASQVAATPAADPIEVLAAVAHLTPETTLKLRRRTIALAATRVFGLTTGTYRVTRGLTVSLKEGVAIDVRALVYEGVRTHVADQQLADAIAPYGSSFVLRPEAQDDVPQFGFSAVELPILDELRIGASIDELAQRHPEVGKRGVLAIVNALLAVHALAPAPEQPALDLAEPALDLVEDGLPRTTLVQAAVEWQEAGDWADDSLANATAVQPPLDLSDDSFGNTTAPQAPLDLVDDPADDRPARTTIPQATFQLTEPQTLPTRGSGQHPALDPPARASTPHPAVETPRRTNDPARPHPALDPTPRPHPALDPTPRPHPALAPRTPPRSTAAPARASVQHPALEPRTPPRPTQHPALERPTPRPTQHPALKRPTPSLTSPRPAQRSTQVPPQRATPPPPVAEPPIGITLRAPRPTVPNPPIPPLAAGSPVVAPPAQDSATQHYERGVALMNRDMEKAVVELRAAAKLSGDVDHLAVLAWGQFCLAPNKETVAKATKAALAKAVYQSRKPEIAHFYLGRLERMLGRDKEALGYFKTVVDLVPRHSEALAEIRTLEARLNPKKR